MTEQAACVTANSTLRIEKVATFTAVASLREAAAKSNQPLIFARSAKFAQSAQAAGPIYSPRIVAGFGCAPAVNGS
jgi:hypothetical protein